MENEEYQGRSFGLALKGWTAWAPNVESRTDWAAWVEGRRGILDNDGCQPAVPEMPMMMRRRLSRLGRIAARASCDVGGIDDATIVYCSRYGESRLTLSLLEDIAVGDLPSPAGFSMAVHNSLAGLLSIFGKNKNGHTAVAAGEESLGAGLLEAAMILAEQPENRVLLIYCHEPLAPIYEPFRGVSEPSLAVALLVEQIGNNSGSAMIGQIVNRTAGHREDLEALAFIRFLLSTDQNETFQSAGVRWAWEA